MKEMKRYENQSMKFNRIKNSSLAYHRKSSMSWKLVEAAAKLAKVNVH